MRKTAYRWHIVKIAVLECLIEGGGGGGGLE